MALGECAQIRWSRPYSATYLVTNDALLCLLHGGADKENIIHVYLKVDIGLSERHRLLRELSIHGDVFDETVGAWPSEHEMCLPVLVILVLVMFRKISNDTVNRLTCRLNEVDGVSRGIPFALLGKVFDLVDPLPVQVVVVHL